MQTFIGKAYVNYFDKGETICVSKNDTLPADTYSLENDDVYYYDFMSILTLLKAKGFKYLNLEDGTRIQF
jgi:hypothetical protein